MSETPISFKFIWDKLTHIPLFAALGQTEGGRNVLYYSCFNYDAEPLLDTINDTNSIPIYYAGERFLDDLKSHITIGFLPNNAFLTTTYDSENVAELEEKPRYLRFLNALTDNKIKELTGLSRHELNVSVPIMIIDIDGQKYPHQAVGVGAYNQLETKKLYIQLREHERNQLEWWLRTEHLTPNMLTDSRYLKQHACVYQELNTRWHAEGQRIRKLGLNTAKPRFCCFVVSNPGCQQRNKFFELMCKKLGQDSPDVDKHKRRVDSLGQYMRNVGVDFIVPNRMDQEEYFKLLRTYRFMITFENHALAHYQTEKIFNAFMAGTVPVYWGDPFIDRVYDTRTFISVPPHESFTKQFNNYRNAIEHIAELEADPVKYISMFDHTPVPNADREDERLHNNLHIISNIGKIVKATSNTLNKDDVNS